MSETRKSGTPGPSSGGPGRAWAIARAAIASSCAVGSIVPASYLLMCYAMWAYSFLSEDRSFVVLSYSWRGFLRAMTDPSLVVPWLLGLPAASASLGGIALVVTREDRAGGRAGRGSPAWVARRFATLGLVAAGLDVAFLAALLSYRIYAWDLT